MVPEAGPTLIHHLCLPLRIEILGDLSDNPDNLPLPGFQQRCVFLNEVEYILLWLRGKAGEGSIQWCYNYKENLLININDEG